ncbi:single-stranded-DNA-specific exonuclease RecJ [Candidatus Woesebacteria bacterium RIFCSPHIGHO2_12_FULL_44_11]|nr:MAG: single-stranded-DNA-specific exonuclease RecJ [Candidatus Woesebacteria bacterium RIFCSPHIGHO2_12_FULL_44_11]
MQWEVKKSITSSKSSASRIVEILLENRGVKNSQEFFNPKHPKDLTLKELGISSGEVKKAAARIKKAIKAKEKIIVYGDYDADGVCATAIAWEALHSLGADVMPYIPERFSEGYGLNKDSIRRLADQNPGLKLILTVDNGIVAHKGVDTANKLGIDVIISDHHQKEKKLPKAYATVHTDKIGGAGLAWILARELGSQSGLELAGIGTIADVLPLIGPNRSFAKYGLNDLNTTQRPGLLELLREAALFPGGVGAYHVGFVIAPRINAMGRLAHALDSLRLLCTPVQARARQLADLLGKTNSERQRIVEEVVAHTRGASKDKSFKGVILLAHESYHEGVIGLAAAKLVEAHWRPAVVIAKGSEMSKASARSIPGFNIIAAIRQLSDLIEEGGGHPMAAGFSIKTERISEFHQKLDEIAKPLLTDEVLSRSLTVDTEIGFGSLTQDLAEKIADFDPTGLGNPTPSFATFGVEVLEARSVGGDNKHLKLVLRNQEKVFEAIAFSFGHLAQKLSLGDQIDIAYNLEENVWNGHKSLQLKVRDIRAIGQDS